MDLQTRVQVPEYPFRFDHRSPSLWMGSCFTEHIGRLAERFLFPVRINPFGVTYNPESVLRGLDALLHKESFTAGDLDQHNGKWFSFDHYTGFSSTDREECLARINHEFEPARKLLPGARLLVLSWGTAWVYRYRSTGRIVCNCHKIPAGKFDRSRLTAEEIGRPYAEFLPQLFETCPGLQVLLTVSPVRHWKDGARGNQLSKSTLLLATEELERRFPEKVFYFPSYEIVMDELRDYRYYSADMLHMGQVAIGYIWERFSEHLLSKESKQINRELEPLLRLLEHRPLDPGGDAHRQTLKQQEALRCELQEKYPFLPWEKWGRNNE